MPAPATHIAVAGTNPDLLCGDYCDLSVFAARPGAPDDGDDAKSPDDLVLPEQIVSFDQLGTAPLASPLRLDRARIEADRVLRVAGWTRLHDWRETPDVLYTRIAPTHGMITVTLVAAARCEDLPGSIALDDPTFAGLPGLGRHPGVTLWRLATGTDIHRHTVARIFPAGVPIPADHPTITVALPCPQPVPDGAHRIVDMRYEDYAEHIARHPALTATGHTGAWAGSTVWLTRAALDILADMPAGTDGRYTGGKIWIGHTGFPVQPLSPAEVSATDRCLTCGSRLQMVRANTGSDPQRRQPCTDPWHTQPPPTT
jgi:hypothetical protein